MKKFLPVMVLAIGCGKGGGDWAKSRSHYCDEVGLLQAQIPGTLAVWTKRFEEVAAKHDPQTCVDAQINVERLIAELKGFTRGAGALAHGRGDDSIEAAGLAIDFGELTVQKAMIGLVCTVPSSVAGVAQELKAAQSTVVKKLDAAVANCKAIGWTSSIK
jgi:hypothetical protein